VANVVASQLEKSEPILSSQISPSPDEITFAKARKGRHAGLVSKPDLHEQLTCESKTDSCDSTDRFPAKSKIALQVVTNVA
jgi:hypothetical protein